MAENLARNCSRARHGGGGASEAGLAAGECQILHSPRYTFLNHLVNGHCADDSTGDLFQDRAEVEEVTFIGCEMGLLACHTCVITLRCYRSRELLLLS